MVRSHIPEDTHCMIYIVWLIENKTETSQVKNTVSHLSLFTGDGNGAVLVVFDGGASLLDEGTIAGSGEEGWDPSPACSDPLCQCALRKSTQEKLCFYIKAKYELHLGRVCQSK